MANVFVVIGVMSLLLVVGSPSGADETLRPTTDADGRALMPEHGRTTTDPGVGAPHIAVPPTPVPELGRVPEPISPAPLLPVGPHAAPALPGSQKAPMLSPPSSGGFTTTGR